MSTEFVEGPTELLEYSPDEPTEQVEEQPADNGQQPQQQQQYTPQPDPNQILLERAEYNRLQAERRIASRQSEETNRKLEYLLNVMAQGAQQQIAAQNQEQLPDEDDLAGQLKYKMAQLEKQNQMALEALQRQETMRQEQELLSQANSHIQEVMQSSPELYTGAMTHLAAIIKNDLAEKFPTMPEPERIKLGEKVINKSKAEALNKGENVAEMLWNKAVLYGFNPMVYQQSLAMQNQSRQQPQQRMDARTQIAQEQKKSRNASIGGMSGAPAAKAPISAGEIKRMTEAEFHAKVTQMQNDGQLGHVKGRPRVPLTSEMLAGKGVKTG